MRRNGCDVSTKQARRLCGVGTAWSSGPLYFKGAMSIITAMSFPSKTAAAAAGLIVPLVFLLALLAVSAGCSSEAFRGSVYESMRYKSNQQNALDPNYNPDSIEEYGQYKAKRDQHLEDRTRQETR